MKRILITGANSYIGTSFEKWVSQWPAKYHVDTIDMIGDSWRGKSFAGYDTVFHVAGIVHSDSQKASESSKAIYYKINTQLTVEAAQKAKREGVKQFIYMSSMLVYGESSTIGTQKVITIETPPHPVNAYGDSKLQAEMGLLPLSGNDFKICILRPPMIYGKGSKGNYPRIAKLALRLPFFPDINNQRSMLYIETLCEFVRLMIEHEEDGTFFPQNAEYVKTSELVKAIAAAHGKNVYLVKWLAPLVRLAGKYIRLVDKVFGNFAYDMQLSEYREEYRSSVFQNSILKTEGKNTYDAQQ